MSNKRWYFLNKVIDDEKLPFVIEITSGGNVYYRMRSGKAIGVLRKADHFRDEKRHSLFISIDPFEIQASGIDKNGKVIYTILKQNELEANEND